MTRQRLEKWIQENTLLKIQFRNSSDVILGRILKVEKVTILVYHDDSKQLLNLALQDIKSIEVTG
ncbi:hypothetical protein [Brevibacillus choshinensis]|uniref:LSM domain-containing protein n=1 Tax=Brevibacillus choshinensis TaxID=54911 RepID=A0ABX7FJU9_BRECH|nr:hypothetical protein [Brevibacillus choshinensis]QRG65900.1 hypothetical protein JNE38_20260 [Brevibacillus choshinensis]